MKGTRTSSLVLAAGLVLSFGLIAAGVRSHAEYIHLKTTAINKPGAIRQPPPAHVRRAERVMNACFVLGGVGLVACMLGALTMGTVIPEARHRGFDVTPSTPSKGGNSNQS